jgi:predicted amidophosphoribosyltransferase
MDGYRTELAESYVAVGDDRRVTVFPRMLDRIRAHGGATASRRTEVGELLYRLKYRNDASALDEIGAVAEKFIRSWRIKFDVIVPAPPTRTRRVQPLHQIADDLSRRFEAPVVKAVSKKAAGAAELKNLREFHERQAVLQGALVVSASAIAGKRVLLVDDLIRSGATLGAVATALTGAGAAIIDAFALTKTRRV